MKHLAFIITLLLVGCSSPQNPTPIPDAPTHQRVQVTLLVAPWCENCLRELPEVESKYLALGDRVSIEAVTETGRQPNSTPSPEAVEIIKNATHVTFNVRMDESKWYLYRKHIGSGNYYLPAALVFAEDEVCENNVCKLSTSFLRSFVAPYTVDELLDYASRQLTP